MRLTQKVPPQKKEATSRDKKKRETEVVFVKAY